VTAIREGSVGRIKNQIRARPRLEGPPFANGVDVNRAQGLIHANGARRVVNVQLRPPTKWLAISTAFPRPRLFGLANELNETITLLGIRPPPGPRPAACCLSRMTATRSTILAKVLQRDGVRGVTRR